MSFELTTLVIPFRDKVSLAVEAKVNGSHFKLNSDVNYQMGNGINEMAEGPNGCEAANLA